VEQRPGNVSRFGAHSIHSFDNVIKLDVQTHRSVSSFYSSKQPFTEGMTVRDWLATQSFDEQRAFGLNVLRRYGVEAK